MPKITTQSNKKNVKKQGYVTRIVNKVGNSRKSSLIFALIAIFIVSGVGAYFVNRSSAATYTAENICGTGYNYQGSVPLKGPAGNDRPDIGRVAIAKNPKTQKYCAVTISGSETLGALKPMMIELKLTRGQTILRKGESESGNFKYFAGPVYVSYDGAPSIHNASTYSSITYKGIKYWNRFSYSYM